jgi:predicted O-methyltransferase YrrM
VALTWTNDTRFVVDDVDFRCSFAASTEHEFCIRKPRRLIEATVDLVAEFPGARAVEFGIASGGSTALLALVARPRTLIAVELAAAPVEALRRLIERKGLVDVVRPHYGVDQGDQKRITEILDAELGGEPLDFVIDDASHQLDATRAAFEAVYPRVRPGGVYVIEDWNWQFRFRYALARGADGVAENRLEFDDADGGLRFGHYLRENLARTPLETLGIELVLTRASSGQVVDDVLFGENWIVVRRGPAALDAATFRLSECYSGAPADFVL